VNPWPWFAGSLALVALGLVLWWTAWLAWPAALVLMAVGLVRVWKHGRTADGEEPMTGTVDLGDG
jgi:hypothetical protein